MTSFSRRDTLAAGAATALLVTAGNAKSSPLLSQSGLCLRDGSAVLVENSFPALVWRPVGEGKWRITRATGFFDIATVDKTIFFSAQFGDVLAKLAIETSGNRWLFSGSLTHNGDKPIELQRFDYLTGLPADGRLGLLAPQSLQGSVFSKPGASASPRNMAFAQMWSGMGVHWGTAPDPVWDEADWSLSRDIGIFTEGWEKPGWTAAFVGPGRAFGEVGLNTGRSKRLFVGQLLDGIFFEGGNVRELERCTLSYGDWQQAIARWVEDVARATAPRKPQQSLAGFCSWYQFYSDVTPAIVENAASQVAAMPTPRTGRLVQIDDGWQKAVGDWTQNDRFKDWPKLAGSIKARGLVPGTYLAPCLVHETLPVVKDHPDWFQRDENGAPAVRFANDDRPRLAFNPDHPFAQDYMRKGFEGARADGWEYIKVDFTYPVAANRTRDSYQNYGAQSRQLTTFESQQNLYRLFREASGPDMLLNACVGEPARYAIGTVDACRLYGDIGTKWATVRENLVPLLLHAPVGGRWFTADPDVFYMRREKNDLSDEENWLLSGSIGLMGGLFLTSDLPSQWSAEARKKVGRFWNEEGVRTPTSQQIAFSVEGVPLAYRVSYTEGRTRHRVGLYNWSDTAAANAVGLAALGLPPGLALGPDSDNGMAIRGGALTVAAQPPHSIRIADIEIV